MRNDKIFHVISNTHWDREWRFPFQRNRQMLVEMIDKVLEILEKEPKYRAFHLDSQSVVLTDYCEIKPHKKTLIQKFVKEKRLFIGPWFILPDEFLVGGENLIRNLLLGHKICKDFGRVSKVGYSPFSWGQISQLPQIYNEFGIDLIMFYRGINSLDTDKAEFIWEGADGTKALASRFSTMPRYNFYFYIYRPVIHNEYFSDVEYKWNRNGTPFHFADSRMCNEDYFVIAPVDTYYKENIKSSVESIVNKQADDFTTQHVIWMEGHDSSGPNIKTVQIIKDIINIFPSIKVFHSTLEDYTNELKKNIRHKSLPIVKGERRSAQYDLRSGNLYGYVTSARMFLKQANFDAERWIQYYAEPFNSVSRLLGNDIQNEYLNIAWNYLIQNSAHDSIGGCSLDEIHYDMMWRYKQVIEISKGVFEQACKYIAKNINTSFNSEKNNNDIFLLAINPNQFIREEIVQTVIDISQDLDKGSLTIKDVNNNTIDFQIISVEDVEPVLEQLIDRPMYFKMRRYNVYLHLKNIPSFGYSLHKIIPSKNESRLKNINLCKLENGFYFLENEFLKVIVNENGTLDVFQKDTKKWFKEIAYFLDEGEAGHAWIHTPLKPFLTTINEKPIIRVIENGNLFTSVSIKYDWKIPYDRVHKKNQNKKFVKIPIDLIIKLSKCSRKLEFEINVDNAAVNHRLRIMFPTGIKASTSKAEGQFDVVERSLERPDTSNWVEQPMYDYPLHNFVDLSDDKIGAAIIVDGLKEYEVLQDKEKTVAITLFRAFTYTIQPSSKEDYSHQLGSQCLGKLNYRIAFYPHKENWEKGEVFREAMNFNNQLSLVQMGNSKGKLPPRMNFFKIEPADLIFSCFKVAEDGNGFVLRFYNPTKNKVAGKISFFKKITKAEQVTLEEKYIKKCKINKDNSISVDVNPKKIFTVRLNLD